MRLDYLLKGLSVLELHGEGNIDVKGITCDSRAVKKGDLFVAVRGSSQDGHRYLAQAVQRGAHALVVEDVESVFRGATIVRLPDTRAALSELAARFYRYPAKHMTLIGITGTNGKTTTSYLLESILKEAGRKVGVIGSVSYRFKGKSLRASLTTPESADLMRIMREMRDAGVTHVIAEVSSHSLEQGRTRGLNWSRVIFTNFSRDHLEYHSTMEEYFKAKSLLFHSLGEDRNGDQVKAVINMDDPKGKVLERITKVPVVSYGLEGDCLVRATDIETRQRGVRFRLVTPSGDIPITSPLLGHINIYNILGAAATAFSLNTDLEIIARGVERLTNVPGRLQPVENMRGLSVYVDYAHTPDALEKVLQTLRRVTTGKLITVFGCGGDRDRGKRPDMGRVAGNYSDLAIITSDNPRGEDPAEIADSVELGMKGSGLKRITLGRSNKERGYEIILDRRMAIRTAINMAKREDIVLIAGKGHEDYQIVGNRKRHFDDVEEAALAANITTRSA
ncbi:MAG: UDP-N-acetylmuramoyl-L-alanyl-D-glutamate--2,6-diaminopimelate ligase [Desulfobacterales bacterium]|nr:UDP-N-acetylmuramoyl-L-alanyl-D-glutamate--2,6-diaminopimelate ligase [Desulfobacterales bacterium]